MPRMPGSSRAARCIRQVEARAQCRGPKYGIRRVGRGPSWSQDAVAHAWLINDAPCTPWPPAPVMTRRQANPAAQPASTHCSHFLATTHGRAGSCHAGLSLQSLRTFCSARPTALRRRAHRPTSASGRPIAANTRAPPCTYDVRLVQLNTDTWAGFGACAFSASHSSEDAGKQAHDLHTSTTAASCPAFLASTGDQGLNTTRRFTLGNGSAPIRIPHAGRDRLTSMRGHALHVDR